MSCEVRRSATQRVKPPVLNPAFSPFLSPEDSSGIQRWTLLELMRLTKEACWLLELVSRP